MSWVTAVLALIRLADTIATWLRENSLLKQGEDKAIAEATATVLAKSAYARQVMTAVTSMTEKQVDDTLKQLEG